MMFTAALLLVIAAAVAQRAPHIPESFSAHCELRLNITYGGNRHILFGRADMAADHNAKMFLFEDRLFSRDHQHYSEYLLSRFDQGKQYEIRNQAHTGCNITTISGNMPSPWSWVSQARFEGRVLFRGHQVDMWGYENRAANTTQHIGVLSAGVNYPYMTSFHNHTSGDRREYVFELFVPHAPSPRVFEVPKQCQHEE